MHFASLVGTRVISIWGATHPYAGFYGYHQDSGDVIQENLPCRPLFCIWAETMFAR